MSYDISNLLLLGLLAVITVASVMIAMVKTELAPAAQLHGKARWYLAAALGAGILFFSVKLLVIVGITIISDEGVVSKSRVAVKDHRSEMKPIRYSWVSLPDSNLSIDSFLNENAHPYRWQSLPELAPSPKNNPTTPEKVKLGRQLFNDT